MSNSMLCRVLAGFLVGLIACATHVPSGVGGEDDVQADETIRARRLEQMRGRARQLTIRIVPPVATRTDSDKQPRGLEIHPQPLFRYDDQPRGFRDATLWMWVDQGKPVAIGKVEDWRDQKLGPSWITCLTSTSNDLIRATWPTGHDWTSKKSGLFAVPIQDGPKPETSEAGRLRQFKALSQRFTAGLQLNEGDRQELRLLPRPLHRYSVPSAEVVDAVIFAWTANGTNPDALLILEQVTLSGKASIWQYSFAPVSADKVWLNLDGRLVQTKERTRFPGDHTVTFNFEKNLEPVD